MSNAWRVVAVLSLLANVALGFWFVLAPRVDRAVMATGQALTEQMIHRQQDAWNRGDLDAFMADYQMSDDTTMYSGGDVRQGWTTILDRYRKTYQAPGASMGELAFTDIRVEALSTEYHLARGKWTVKLADGKTPTGLFTLVVRKTPQGWKIVHDHTSAAKEK